MQKAKTCLSRTISRSRYDLMETRLYLKSDFFNLNNVWDCIQIFPLWFNDYDNNLAYLQIPTHDSLEQSVTELVVIFY